MSQATRLEPRNLDDPRAALSHPDALYEVVDGQVVELPEMGIYAIAVANAICFEIVKYLQQRPVGRALTEAVFILDRMGELRRRPDVAFVSFDRWPANREIPEEGDWEVVPDLCIEVVSPNDTSQSVLRKIHEYFDHSARRVWTVHPSERLIYVYASPTEVHIHGPDDEIDGEALLPGFRLPVGSLFRRTLA